MNDNEIRGIVLRHYYDRRYGGADQWHNEDVARLGHGLTAEIVFAICGQLADQGLIGWRPINIKGLVANGFGKITAYGVDVIEGTATAPMSIAINQGDTITVAQSSNVQIGNSNSQTMIIDSEARQNTMATPDTGQSKALRFLRAIYEQTRNNEEPVFVLEKIKDEIGLSEKEAKAAWRYLKDKQLIDTFRIAYTARINAHGIDAIERARLHPDQPHDLSEKLGDRALMLRSIELSRRCKSEVGKISPKVGAIIARDGIVIGEAFRGEIAPGEHAEFTLLERKLANETLAGATLYVTLEPCTSRNDPKIACAERIAERRIAKVFIGVLRPEPNNTWCW